MARPEGMIISEHEMDLGRMSVRIGEGDGKVGDVEKEREQEAARVFNMQSRGEGWKHAAKANPKALLWCECQSIVYLQRFAEHC